MGTGEVVQCTRPGLGLTMVWRRLWGSLALVLFMCMVRLHFTVGSRYNLTNEPVRDPPFVMECPESLYDIDQDEAYNFVSSLDAPAPVLQAKYPKSRRKVLRDRVQSVFNEAYTAYLNWAFPQDELRPLTLGGKRAFPILGVPRPADQVFSKYYGFALTQIDSLSTLALMNQTEFLLAIERTTNLLNARPWGHLDILVNVFEANIRLVGGLLSAHALASSESIMGKELYFNYTLAAQEALTALREADPEYADSLPQSQLLAYIDKMVLEAAQEESRRHGDNIPRYRGQLLFFAESLARRLVSSFERVPECDPSSTRYENFIADISDSLKKLKSRPSTIKKDAPIVLPVWLRKDSPVLQRADPATPLSPKDVVERVCALRFNASLPTGRARLKALNRFEPRLDNDHNCIAAAGTLLLEFGYLSTLLRDKVFFEAADSALSALRRELTSHNLLGTSFVLKTNTAILHNAALVILACQDDFLSPSPGRLSAACIEALEKRAAAQKEADNRSSRSPQRRRLGNVTLNGFGGQPHVYELSSPDDGTRIQWQDRFGGVGAGSDSYYEYLLKGSFFFGNSKYLEDFKLLYQAVLQHMYKAPWYRKVHMEQPWQSRDENTADILAAFWPGLQTLIGDLERAKESVDAFFRTWLTYGSTPERFVTSNLQASEAYPYYPLRPELVESIYLMYRATRHPRYLAMGEHILRDLIRITRTVVEYSTDPGSVATDPNYTVADSHKASRRWRLVPANIGCGRFPPKRISDVDVDVNPSDKEAPPHITTTGVPYSALKRAAQLVREDNMPSFFLAETLKYLYLLFDEENPLHTPPDGHHEWIFTTEAHPLPLTIASQNMFGDMSMYSTYDAAPTHEYDTLKLFRQGLVPGTSTSSSYARAKVAALGLIDSMNRGPQAVETTRHTSPPNYSSAPLQDGVCPVSTWKAVLPPLSQSLLDVWSAENGYIRTATAKRVELAKTRNVALRRAMQSAKEVSDAWALLDPNDPEAAKNRDKAVEREVALADDLEALAAELRRTKAQFYELVSRPGGFSVALSNTQCNPYVDEMAAKNTSLSRNLLREVCTTGRIFENATFGDAGQGLIEIRHRTRHNPMLYNTVNGTNSTGLREVLVRLDARNFPESERSQILLGLEKHPSQIIQEASLFPFPSFPIFLMTVEKLQYAYRNGKLDALSLIKAVRSVARILDVDPGTELSQLTILITALNLPQSVLGEASPTEEDLSKLAIGHVRITKPIVVETALVIDSPVCAGVIGATTSPYAPLPPRQPVTYQEWLNSRKDSQGAQTTFDLYSPPDPTNRTASGNEATDSEHAHAWLAAPLVFIDDYLCSIPEENSETFRTFIAASRIRETDPSGLEDATISVELDAATGQATPIQPSSRKPFQDRVVVIPRGKCLFVDKIRNAAKLGAVGMIIVNDRPFDHSFGMGTDPLWNEEDVVSFILDRVIPQSETAHADSLKETWTDRIRSTLQPSLRPDVGNRFPIPAVMVSNDAGQWLKSCAVNAQSASNAHVRTLQAQSNYAVSPKADGVMDVAIAAVSYHVPELQVACHLTHKSKLTQFYQLPVRPIADGNRPTLSAAPEMRIHIVDSVARITPDTPKESDAVASDVCNWDLLNIIGGEVWIMDMSLAITMHNDHVSAIVRNHDELQLKVLPKYSPEW